MKRLLPALGVTLLLLTSCAKQDAVPAAGAPHATIRLRDGSRVTGAVLASSASEVKVAGDDNITRTIPMAQVRSIDYGEAPPATAPATPPPVSSSSAAPPAPPPPADSFHEEHEHPAAAAITTKTYRVPAGTEISVRNEETIDSAQAVEGQTFAAEVTRAVKDEGGDVVIPRGANAQIIIRSAAKGGKFKGQADLVMDLASVSVDGRQYALDTVDIHEKGKQGVGANKRTGEFAGGGAAIGAIIGAIAGGGKGAAIGAGSGAGAGVAAQVLTKGGSIKVPVETVLTFKLERPLRIVAR
jgi:hypothetical protein